jgi:hypothetical protein
MSLRRVIVPICLGVTVVLLFFLGLTTYPELRRAHRFENAQAALQELPPSQRLQVLDRIAWLNGTPTMPSVETSGMSNSDKQLRKAIDLAKARLAAARPLPPDLEELARDANARPQWAVIQWRALLFATAITVLWGLFFLASKITSEGRASARQGLF